MEEVVVVAAGAALAELLCAEHHPGDNQDHNPIENDIFKVSILKVF